MKQLSIAIPCYNSAAYMNHAIDSLLHEIERIEIIIIDDGSSDNTINIAWQYAREYPDSIFVVSQANGGHGAAVNAGIKNATGLYFKVLDSDDWLDQTALTKLLNVIDAGDHSVDAYIVNYVYEKTSMNRKKVMEYKKHLVQNIDFGWDAVHFPVGVYFMMHSFVHRTDIVKKSVNLPHHTFYVDNLYILQASNLVFKMQYLDLDLYRYFIGRDEQSVNEKVMIKRINQQLLVNRECIRLLNDAQGKHNYTYVFHHVEIVTAISTVMLRISNTEEDLQKIDTLWKYIFEVNKDIYKELRNRPLGSGLNQRWKGSRFLIMRAYHISRRIFGFN